MATLTTVQNYNNGETIDQVVLRRPISQLNANQLAINAEVEVLLADSTTGLNYIGVFDASVNTNPIGTFKIGDLYKISVQGTVGGIVYNVGDFIMYDGSTWDLIDNTEKVTSVAGKDGDVVLEAADITNFQTAVENIGDARWASQATSGAFDGFLFGLQTSIGIDVEHDITVSAGKAAAVGGTPIMISPSAKTKRIDANWVEGNNAGGFASALSLTADTWYAFFAIGKADGTTDFGWDTDLAATNLLADAAAAGYVAYRRIGWHRTDVNSNIRGYFQVGDEFCWNKAIAEVIETRIPTIPTLYTTFTPPLQLGRFLLYAVPDEPNSGTNVIVKLWSPLNPEPFVAINEFDTGDVTTKQYFTSWAFEGTTEVSRIVDENSQLYAASSGPKHRVGIATKGWTDTRGKYY